MKIIAYKSSSYYEVSILFMKYYDSLLVFKIGSRTTYNKHCWVRSLTPDIITGKYKLLFNFGDEE